MNAKWGKYYYSAFISCINPDGTYNVYYPEDGEKRTNVPPKEIKPPLMAGKSSRNTEAYLERTFCYSSDSEDDIQSGEFVVSKLSTNNQFMCTRVKFNENEPTETIELDMGYVIKKIAKYADE